MRRYPDRSLAGSPELLERYAATRNASDALAASLSAEDCVVQSMPDASPIKWHLAHTTWFFETFVLEAMDPTHRPFLPEMRVLFNSYYNTVGDQHPRAQRGMLTRPSLEQVWAYRAHVDSRMEVLLASPGPELERVVQIGLNHEQQHQELMLMDIKDLFARNPLRPAFRERNFRIGTAGNAAEQQWLGFDAGLRQIGHHGDSFAFDNEQPRHAVWLDAFAIASRPVTNGEFVQFIEDGGYARPELWLADGWARVQDLDWDAPAYWSPSQGGRSIFTLAGVAPLRAEVPVCHVSYYEADAFARWSGARLPTEAEWETAAAGEPVHGNFVESRLFHPAPSVGRQFFGDVWEWTQSPYVAYPGYRPPSGALGEYNGKFMCNQMVLRGGSCVTPADHVRPTYRNFFYPDQRWQFGGIRLARDV